MPWSHPDIGQTQGLSLDDSWRRDSRIYAANFSCADLSEQLAGAQQMQLKRRACIVSADGRAANTFINNGVVFMRIGRRLPCPGFHGAPLRRHRLAVSTLLPGRGLRRRQAKEIRIDWATYNPVSHGAEGARACWRRNSPRTASASAGCSPPAPTRRSNSSTPARSISARPPARRRWSAGSTAIRSSRSTSIRGRNGPRWSPARTRKIKNVADLKGKRVAVTRGTDPHIFLVRALHEAGLTEKDITPVLLQHADGKTALIRGDVDAWAGLDPMMAQAESRTARGCSTATPTPTPGASSMCARSS